jgi:hypothetical protein
MRIKQFGFGVQEGRPVLRPFDKMKTAFSAAEPGLKQRIVNGDMAKIFGDLPPPPFLKLFFKRKKEKKERARVIAADWQKETE